MKLLRPILERLALLGGSLLFCLVLGEFAARLYYHVLQGGGASFEDRLERSQNTAAVEVGHTTNLGGLIKPSAFPDIVYELKPNITGLFVGHRFSFNSFGMRDREFTPAKPSGVKRIVGLGDSILFGWGVGQDDAYLKVVERELNKNPSGAKWEVLNFGVPGYNTAMEAAVLKHHASRFSPDIILVHFVRNDFSVPLFMEEPESTWDLHRSYLLRFIAERLPGTAAGRKLLNATRLKPGQSRKVINRYRYMLGPKGFLHAMEIIKNVAQEHEAEVIVITGSAKGKVGRFLAKNCERFGFRLVTASEDVEAYFVGIGEPLSKEEQSALISVSPKDSHPNVLGHSLYAKTLLKQLDRMAAAGAAASPAIAR